MNVLPSPGDFKVDVEGSALIVSVPKNQGMKELVSGGWVAEMRSYLSSALGRTNVHHIGFDNRTPRIKLYRIVLPASKRRRRKLRQQVRRKITVFLKKARRRAVGIARQERKQATKPVRRRFTPVAVRCSTAPRMRR